MPLLHDDGGSHHLVVGRLIKRLLRIFILRETDPRIRPAENIDGGIGLVVDLVEGHPVFDLIFISFHDTKRIADKEFHQLAVGPAAVLLGQVVGHLKVAQCDHRLNAILQELIKQVIVKLKARLIGLRLVALGENAAPGDGCAEALETQLRKQFHILFIGMEKIDALVVGIVLAGHHAVRDAAGHLVGSACHHIADTGSSAVCIPCAFELMCRYRAAPQKIF